VLTPAGNGFRDLHWQENGWQRDAEQRRHRSQSQRACIALDMLPMLEAEARERQKGGQGGVLLEERIPQANRRARDAAAQATGANPHYVSDAGTRV